MKSTKKRIKDLKITYSFSENITKKEAQENLNKVFDILFKATKKL